MRSGRDRLYLTQGFMVQMSRSSSQSLSPLFCRLRLPQIVLAVPLAFGLYTNQVAGALALLVLLEALTVWQWWRPSVMGDVDALMRVSEHFAINISVSGGLLLLQRGAGRFSLDSLRVKKRI